MVRKFIGDQNPHNLNDYKKAEKTEKWWRPDYWESWHMAGGYGNDTLIGGLKNDTLHGGLGDDSLRGGKGNDRYYIDSHNDKVVEYANEGTDTIYSRVTHTLGSNFEKLLLIPDSRAIGAYGNSKDNYLGGNHYKNYMYGYAGNDTLEGKDGNDYLVGGYGNDTLNGGNGNDTMRGTHHTGDSHTNEQDLFTGGSGTDTVVLGNRDYVYYNSNKNNDLATITDFSGISDKLRLAGQPSTYVLSDDDTSAYLYYDADASGTVTSGDDMMARFIGMSKPQLNFAVVMAEYV